MLPSLERPPTQATHSDLLIDLGSHIQEAPACPSTPQCQSSQGKRWSLTKGHLLRRGGIRFASIPV